MALMVVLDANGNPVTIVVQVQGATTDFSGSIGAASSQEVAPPNANRSGLYFQNKGANVMTLNDEGDADEAEAFIVAPGQSWPPSGYDVPVTAINIGGTEGDSFLYREW